MGKRVLLGGFVVASCLLLAGIASNKHGTPTFVTEANDLSSGDQGDRLVWVADGRLEFVATALTPEAEAVMGSLDDPMDRWAVRLSPNLFMTEEAATAARSATAEVLVDELSACYVDTHGLDDAAAQAWARFVVDQSYGGENNESLLDGSPDRLRERDLVPLSTEPSADEVDDVFGPCGEIAGRWMTKLAFGLHMGEVLDAAERDPERFAAVVVAPPDLAEQFCGRDVEDLADCADRAGFVAAARDELRQSAASMIEHGFLPS